MIEDVFKPLEHIKTDKPYVPPMVRVPETTEKIARKEN